MLVHENLRQPGKLSPTRFLPKFGQPANKPGYSHSADPRPRRLLPFRLHPDHVGERHFVRGEESPRARRGPNLVVATRQRGRDPWPRRECLGVRCRRAVVPNHRPHPQECSAPPAAVAQNFCSSLCSRIGFCKSTPVILTLARLREAHARVAPAAIRLRCAAMGLTVESVSVCVRRTEPCSSCKADISFRVVKLLPASRVPVSRSADRNALLLAPAGSASPTIPVSDQLRVPIPVSLRHRARP